MRVLCEYTFHYNNKILHRKIAFSTKKFFWFNRVDSVLFLYTHKLHIIYCGSCRMYTYYIESVTSHNTANRGGCKLILASHYYEKGRKYNFFPFMLNILKKVVFFNVSFVVTIFFFPSI